MAGFVYRMQNILDIKYKLEDQKKQEYAQIQRRLDDAEEYLATLEARLLQDVSNLREATTGTLDLLNIENCKNTIIFRREQITRQKGLVLSLRNETEKARVRLNEAMQERKMHEKLKENQYAEFMQELEQQESKEIDQLVSYTFNHKEQQNGE